MFMPIADPSISLEENTKIAAKQNAALMTFPEVAYVVAKVARADTSTDPAPLNMTETIVHLKPRDAVAAGHDARPASRGDGPSRAAAGRLEHLDDADHQPDRHAHDRHPVRSRREGVRHRSARARGIGAAAWRRCVRSVPGASNVYPEQVTSGQYLNIEVDRVGGGALRHRRRRHPAGHRDRRRRDRR